jgi:hypothetical protein
MRGSMMEKEKKESKIKGRVSFTGVSSKSGRTRVMMLLTGVTTYLANPTYGDAGSLLLNSMQFLKTRIKSSCNS